MEKKPVKIAFFGSDEISLPFLDALLNCDEDLEIVAVLTQPDRKSGRGRILHSNPIKKWAHSLSIPVHDPSKPGVEQVEWLKEKSVDLILVMAYGHILNNHFLNLAPLGCFNLHASLLPKYRGASPIETAVALGEEKTGVTLMQVVPRMDAGPIVDSQVVPILSSDTGLSLRLKIAQASVPLILRSLPVLLSGNCKLMDQREEEASYCRKLRKDDGLLDFSLSAQELISRNCAFSSWPGSFFVDRKTVLKVGKMRKVSNSGMLKVGQRDPGFSQSLIIGTGDGKVEIQELQKPGGKMLPVADFLRGYSIPENIIFISSQKPLPLLR